MEEFVFLTEPKGEAYRQLLEYAAKTHSLALLADPEKEVTASRNDFFKEMAPHLVSRELRHSCPGTEMPYDKAAIYTYRLDKACVEKLLEFTDGLFQWLETDLPTDLAFLRPDGTAWLWSVAHERDRMVTAIEAMRDESLDEETREGFLYTLAEFDFPEALEAMLEVACDKEADPNMQTRAGAAIANLWIRQGAMDRTIFEKVGELAEEGLLRSLKNWNSDWRNELSK
ncbi:MAG: hypothetical protein COB53_04285 [Elusimicrobia bacterium]|nr:MAG: hypothetical protein COB53_04285 [Elusimicrobiota bacterium]